MTCKDATMWYVNHRLCLLNGMRPVDIAADCYSHSPWSGFMLDHDAVHMQLVMLTAFHCSVG
jgi:hypothetical protein